MIRVTRLDGSSLTVNCDLVEAVEHTPDTVLSLLNNRKLVVRESVDEIVDRVVEYRRRTRLCPLLGEHDSTALIRRLTEQDAAVVTRRSSEQDSVSRGRS